MRLPCSAARADSSSPEMHSSPLRRLPNQAFHACSVVVPVIVVTGPDPLPAPGGRLPSPTRSAVETYANAEWHHREGEAAMTEPMEPRKRNPIKARRKPWPERETARPDKSTMQTGAAEASAHNRTPEASTHRPGAKSSNRPAAKAPASHSAAKATH